MEGPDACIYYKRHTSDEQGARLSQVAVLPQVGAAVAALGTPEFPGALATLLRSVAGFDYTVAFGYRGSARPLDLYDDFPATRRRVFVTDYQAGPYVLDPFFLAATRPVAAGLHRMRDLAPDRFYQGEYFRNYYVRTGLAEEIGYFVDVPGGAMVVLSLMRAERPFGTRDIRPLRELWPVVAACARQQWGDLAGRFSDRPTRADGLDERRLERSFQSFGAGVLTPREREIVEHTLKGHSAEAVGRLLGISPGTVRIHRRNIYGKLRIGSQGELFMAFIRTLGSDQAQADSPPRPPDDGISAVRPSVGPKGTSRTGRKRPAPTGSTA
jgi:DNA-binding CsgD family transcriptional regulator